MRLQKYYFFRMEDILPEKLFEADNANDEGYSIDVLVWKFKRIIFFVVGNDEDVLLVRSGLYALDNRALCRVEDVRLAPLKE